MGAVRARGGLFVGCLLLIVGTCGSDRSVSTESPSTTSAALSADTITFRPVLAVCPADGAVGSGPNPPVPSFVPQPESSSTPDTGAPENVVTPHPAVLPADWSETRCVGSLDSVPHLDASGAVLANYALGPVLVDALSLESATASEVQGHWVVNPVFREGPDGVDRFNAAAAFCYEQTTECPTGELAIVMDGTVISAPTINQATFQRDQIQISGDFTEASAEALAQRLTDAAGP